MAAKTKFCWCEVRDGLPIRIFRSSKMAFADLMVDPILWIYADAVAAIRGQVWKRCGGFCEKCGAVVTESEGELHEVVHRGQGGMISLDNSKFFCYICHREAHSDRNPKFIRREK